MPGLGRLQWPGLPGQPSLCLYGLCLGSLQCSSCKRTRPLFSPPPTATPPTIPHWYPDFFMGTQNSKVKSPEREPVGRYVVCPELPSEIIQCHFHHFLFQLNRVTKSGPHSRGREFGCVNPGGNNERVSVKSLTKLLHRGWGRRVGLPQHPFCSAKHLPGP